MDTPSCFPHLDVSNCDIAQTYRFIENTFTFKLCFCTTLSLGQDIASFVLIDGLKYPLCTFRLSQ